MYHGSPSVPKMPPPPPPPLSKRENTPTQTKKFTRSPEEQPIKVHNTPFRLRVQRAIVDDYRAGLENESRPQSPSAVGDENVNPLQDVTVEFENIKDLTNGQNKKQQMLKVQLALEAQKRRTGSTRNLRLVSNSTKNPKKGDLKKECRDNNSALDKMIGDLKKEVKVKTQVIYELTELSEDLKAKNREQRKQIQVKEGSISVLGDQLSKMENDIQALQHTIKEQHNTIAKLREEGAQSESGAKSRASRKGSIGSMRESGSVNMGKDSALYNDLQDSKKCTGCTVM